MRAWLMYAALFLAGCGIEYHSVGSEENPPTDDVAPAVPSVPEIDPIVLPQTPPNPVPSPTAPSGPSPIDGLLFTRPQRPPRFDPPLPCVPQTPRPGGPIVDPPPDPACH